MQSRNLIDRLTEVNLFIDRLTKVNLLIDCRSECICKHTHVYVSACLHNAHTYEIYTHTSVRTHFHAYTYTYYYIFMHTCIIPYNEWYYEVHMKHGIHYPVFELYQNSH